MRIKQLIVVGSFLLAISNSVADYDSPGGIFANGNQFEAASAVQSFPCPLVLSKLFHCKPMGLHAYSRSVEEAASR